MSAEDGWPDTIAEDHRQLLIDGGINAATAIARGYETIKDPRRLAVIGIAKAGQRTMGMLQPRRGFDGSVTGHQFRPDHPREVRGKTRKYETPFGQTNQLDIPPAIRNQLLDRERPLWFCERTRKADSAAQRGLCAVGMNGVNGWMHTCPITKDKVPLPELKHIPVNDRDVVIALDNDIETNMSVTKAALGLARILAARGAKVRFLYLPNDGTKTGLDDYLFGHTIEDLMLLVRPEPPVYKRDSGSNPAPEPSKVRTVPIVPTSLRDLHTACRKWLGDHYDLEAIDAALSAAVVERYLVGDPVWLLIVSGSGATKTETVVMLCDEYDDTVRDVSSISSIGALISASAAKDRTANATGGILKELEPRGLLILKDVTSILAMPSQVRDLVLSVLREVYDGFYTRDAGVDGGVKIPWRGRIAIVGAVTTAWDRAHAVVARMGDRFVLVRMDSKSHRIDTGRRAIGNTGAEATMREELNRLALGVIKKAGQSPEVELTGVEQNAILRAADLVTLARTAVDTDSRGDVIDSNDPEMPTRFAKQLTQVFRGAVTIGLNRQAALGLAIRCARDSVPPLRLAIITDLVTHPASKVGTVAARLGKPYNTVNRQMQALWLLRVVDAHNSHGAVGLEYGNANNTTYSLNPDRGPDSLDFPEISSSERYGIEEEVVKGGEDSSGARRVDRTVDGRAAIRLHLYFRKL